MNPMTSTKHSTMIRARRKYNPVLSEMVSMNPSRGPAPMPAVTLRLAKLVSTSKAKHSRVYASTTLSTRIARPHSTASCTKSNAHSWFAEVLTNSGFPSRTQCFRFFRRIISPAARYTRCTRLWFTALPSGPATHATADTRSAAWTAPTPPAAFVAVHHYACSGSDSSTPP